MTHRILIKSQGPLVLTGDIEVETVDGDTIIKDKEVYLCRCGKSANKPFCDGAHKQVSGFGDDVMPSDDKAESPMGEEPLRVTVRANAMLIAKGPMQIETEDGSFKTTRNKAALCRCGQSQKKHFCDASHKACGFSAE